MSQRKGINTDERRAKAITYDYLFLKGKDFNGEKFQNLWNKFLAEKVRYGNDIVEEFIKRWNEFQ